MIQKPDCVQAGWPTKVTVTLKTCHSKISWDKNAFWKLSVAFLLHCNLVNPREFSSHHIYPAHLFTLHLIGKQHLFPYHCLFLLGRKKKKHQNPEKSRANSAAFMQGKSHQLQWETWLREKYRSQAKVFILVFQKLVFHVCRLTPYSFVKVAYEMPSAQWTSTIPATSSCCVIKKKIYSSLEHVCLHVTLGIQPAVLKYTLA